MGPRMEPDKIIMKYSLKSKKPGEKRRMVRTTLKKTSLLLMN
jgi:hypothetical protein